MSAVIEIAGFSCGPDLPSACDDAVSLEHRKESLPSSLQVLKRSLFQALSDHCECLLGLSQLYQGIVDTFKTHMFRLLHASHTKQNQQALNMQLCTYM